jgi:hypothetical protein
MGQIRTTTLGERMKREYMRDELEERGQLRMTTIGVRGQKSLRPVENRR